MVSRGNLICRHFIPSSLFLILVLAVSQSTFASVIGGFVYDQNRNPLVEVDVELLNENYQIRDRRRTNGLGRYEFTNVADGRYYVKVLPFRYDVEDDQQYVEVNTLSLLGGGGGASYFNQDFYLPFKKGGLADTETGVIFAQDIPKDAEELYKEAMKDLAKDREEDGMKKLIGAITIFPKYYYALMVIGKELLKRKQYLDATRAFIEAAEVNPKSSSAFYNTGLALSMLGPKYNKAAIASLNKAADMATASAQVVYLLGKLERKEGNFTGAEKHLVQAKKLTKIRVPEYHIELAQLYADDLKQYGKAADELELYMKASKKKDKVIEKQIADLRAKAKSGS
jgi:tetratricopeptide (TPR) repeat protein